jgi:hypothetical protein
MPVSIIATPAMTIHKSPDGAPVKANEPELDGEPDPGFVVEAPGESVTAADAALDVGALVAAPPDEPLLTGIVVPVVVGTELVDPTVNGTENNFGAVKSFWS